MTPTQRAPTGWFAELKPRVILAIALAAAGCSENGPILDTAAAQDQEVLEVVLADLLVCSDVWKAVGEADGVVVNGTTPFADESRIIDDDHIGFTLSPSQREECREALADLRARYIPSESLLDLGHFRSPLIRWGREETRPGALIDDEGRVGAVAAHAWLPGYSTDGSAAVVRLMLPASGHVGSATYLVRRLDGEWSVAWRVVGYST